MEKFNRKNHIGAREAKGIIDSVRNAFGGNLHVFFNEFGEASVVRVYGYACDVLVRSKTVWDDNSVNGYGTKGTARTVFERKEVSLAML